MAVRTAVLDFSLANPLYVAATVTFYTVDPVTGAKTTTPANLYAQPTGTQALPNPQVLDSQGKFKRPVYIDDAVVAVVSGLSVGDHETGVIRLDSHIAAEEAAAARASRLAADADAVATALDRAAASDAAADAQAYSDRAHAWAEEGEGVEVLPGQYSARHWAIKAMENSGGMLEAHGFRHNGTALEWTHGISPFDAVSQHEWSLFPTAAIFSLNANGHLEVTF